MILRCKVKSLFLPYSIFILAIILLVSITNCEFNKSSEDESENYFLKVDSLINPSFLSTKYNFNNSDLDKYNKWIEEALIYSIKNNEKILVINKSAYSLILIDSGYVKKFYKALLLNYPNEYNWRNFNNAINLNLIDQDVSIGGNIEIHGIGTGKRPGKGGRNWTWGCIALSNDDIDDLFARIDNEIRVTIVRYTSIALNKKELPINIP